MVKNSKFRIITADQRIHDIEAPSLRTALRNSGIDERKTPILAAVEAGMLPPPMAADKPFMVVLLRNANFLPPE